MSSSECRPERWKAVPGYAGYYEVSDLGRVRSVDRIVATGYQAKRFAPGRLLKPGWTREGHLFVALCRDGKPKNSRVHRLVLEAFVGLCPEKMECCHRDGNATNNAVENLYWGTRSENCFDRERHRRERATAREGQAVK